MVFFLIIFITIQTFSISATAQVKIGKNKLPLSKSVTQYGITWTFEKPVRVGQFVNGDYYVLGPATIVAISPEPRDGRNGSCLDPSAITEKAGFDDRILFGRYDPNLFLAPPIKLIPGNSLLSSVSLEEIHTIKPRPENTAYKNLQCNL